MANSAFDAFKSYSSRLISDFAAWLGIEEDPNPVSKRERQEQYLEEDYSLKKWSYAWLHHRVKPSTSLFVILMVCYFILGILNFLDYLPSFPRLIEILLIPFSAWLVLRWLSKKAQPQTGRVAKNLRIKARGMYWWFWISAAERILTLVLTGLASLLNWRI